jgi:hypothetical protein
LKDGKTLATKFNELRPANHKGDEMQSTRRSDLSDFDEVTLRVNVAINNRRPDWFETFIDEL